MAWRQGDRFDASDPCNILLTSAEAPQKRGRACRHAKAAPQLRARRLGQQRPFPRLQCVSCNCQGSCKVPEPLQRPPTGACCDAAPSWPLREFGAALHDHRSARCCYTPDVISQLLGVTIGAWRRLG